MDFAPGEATGLAVPAHPDALRQAGAEWLTQAFRAYGALAPDNAVTRIVRCEAFAGGNSGDKLLLDVEYARPDAALHTQLFVKFSLCLGDPFRDRRRHELHGEVRLAGLSRNPAFPVAVARPYFADFDPASGIGVLITQRIRFGEQGIEPVRVKNMDHELDSPLEYYRATVTALARLAAAHQSGRLSPEADRLFPFEPETAAAAMPIPWDEAQVQDKAAEIGKFIAECPQFFPANVAAPAFAARLARDALALYRHDGDTRRFLFGDPQFIALAHWNTHIDNAWFWRNEAGVLQAGLLDWGMVRQMNVATALWGGLSGAALEVWGRHLDELLALFVAELAANGGARLDQAELALHLDLAVATMCLALMMDTPALIRSRMPDIADLTGPGDPRIARDKVVQGFLHTFTACLNLWERRHFGASLARMLNK
jgi:hypothetical protein